MKKPIIGILTSIENDRNYLFPGYTRIVLNEDYTKSIEMAGAIPILIAPHRDIDILNQQLELVDAILLTGGADVNPLLYNEQPHQKLGEISPLRDDFEYMAIQIAVENKIPIMGVCRGLQILNVYFGGSLYQDHSMINGAFKHMNFSNPSVPVHDVEISENSFLHKSINKLNTKVNSFHHQSIKKVADKFKIVSKAKDGVIEAIESNSDDHFIMAVQWHPEMMNVNSDEARAIFKYFITKVYEFK